MPLPSCARVTLAERELGRGRLDGVCVGVSTDDVEPSFSCR
jgi:hypothetical protein